MLQGVIRLLESIPDTMTKADPVFNEPISTDLMPRELQQEMLSVLTKVGGKAKVEVFDDVNSVKFKIRQEHNPFLEGVDVYVEKKILEGLRREINKVNKKFKRCKVFYLVYECEPEMNSINVVYNPAWKKYENYEILFRSHTQLRRSRGV